MTESRNEVTGGASLPPGHEYLSRAKGPPSGGAPAAHDGLAIASLILSLLWLGGLGSLLGVIFGHSSRGQAKRQGRATSGLATAGTVLGWIGLAAIAIVIIIVIIVAASSHSGPNCTTDPSTGIIYC